MFALQRHDRYKPIASGFGSPGDTLTFLDGFDAPFDYLLHIGKLSRAETNLEENQFLTIDDKASSVAHHKFKSMQVGSI